MQPAIKRNQRWLPALVVMVLIFWFSSLPGEQVGQTARPALDHAPKTVTLEPLGKPVRIQWLKVGHGVGYALLGLAYLYALRPVNRRAAGAAVLLALGYAIFDEMHQSFVPGRSASLVDVVLDTAAAGGAVAVWLLAFRYRSKNIKGQEKRW
jgi:VanZ family protein